MEIIGHLPLDCKINNKILEVKDIYNIIKGYLNNEDDIFYFSCFFQHEDYDFLVKHTNRIFKEFGLENCKSIKPYDNYTLISGKERKYTDSGIMINDTKNYGDYITDFTNYSTFKPDTSIIPVRRPGTFSRNERLYKNITVNEIMDMNKDGIKYFDYEKIESFCSFYDNILNIVEKRRVKEIKQIETTIPDFLIPRHTAPYKEKKENLHFINYKPYSHFEFRNLNNVIPINIKKNNELLKKCINKNNVLCKRFSELKTSITTADDFKTIHRESKKILNDVLSEKINIKSY